MRSKRKYTLEGVIIKGHEAKGLTRQVYTIYRRLWMGLPAVVIGPHGLS